MRCDKGRYLFRVYLQLGRNSRSCFGRPTFRAAGAGSAASARKQHRGSGRHCGLAGPRLLLVRAKQFRRNSHKEMSNLQPGWRRKPLPDCPLCGGRGKIEFHLYSQVKTKFRDPQDEERAASWMAYAATSEGACSCVRWSRTHDFYQRLRQVRKHMDRVKKSKMMMKQP